MDFEMTTLAPRSVMPAGGTPEDDRRYLAWKASWLAEQNARLTDRHAIRTGRLPDREPIDPASLDEILWTAMGNARLIEPPTYHHRLRSLALAYRDSRRRLLRASQLHAARCAARLEQEA